MDKLLISLLTCGVLILPMSCISHQSWQTRLDSDEPAQRIRAIRDIANVGDQQLAPYLVACLDDEDVAVRFYAIMGLERLTGERLGYTYHGTHKERALAITRWQQHLIKIGVVAKSTHNATSEPGQAATNVPAQSEHNNG